MNTRRFLLVGALVLCMGASALAQAENKAAPKMAAPSRVFAKQESDTAAALLNKHVDSVDWVEITFEEVIDWLRDLSDGSVNVIPRWSALGVDSVTPESLITLKLSNVNVTEVLNEVLGQLSEDNTLGYQAVRNNLRISTKGDFNRRMYVRVYDVTDILFRVYDFGEEAPQIDLQQAGQNSGGGGGGSGQSVFSGSSSSGGSRQQGGKQAEEEVKKQLEDLKALIEHSIEPSSWSETGTGGQGTIELFHRSLVVYATIDVHEKIAGFFRYGGTSSPSALGTLRRQPHS